IETDKAVMELVARGNGVLRKQLVAEGTTAPVGTLVGVIAAADEDISALIGGAAAAPAAAATAAAAPAAVAAAAATVAAPAATVGVGSAKSSPLARRLAKDSGLDLGAIEGSGPGGRIIKRDIEAAVAGGGSTASSTVNRPPSTVSDYTDQPLTQIRKTIAKRLGESIGPIPTFYLTAEFDMTRAAEMRASAAALGDEFKISFNDILLKATATALAAHPEINAHWLGDQIRFFNRVHLGMAVATDDGLIVPVLFDADQKGLREISRESKELAKRARERKLKPEEYTGSTFSVSNLGMMQIDQFTAIINPPESGILAIGALEDKPVVIDGELVIRKRLRVTMSCDHRVIDGAIGARFLQDLRRMIENPLMLVF
ncbi:MAG: dihydrolipoamide acetyltransferase family protein, partial [Gemmatimonadetes bacterium]|nr:dihydrolipoamide acetyltransferase family protein [Gemmatimonadota bacterium]